MHVVVKSLGRLVEIQVRTSLQHIWAELSEKYSDVLDPSIKYGGGEEKVKELLTSTSLLIARVESLEIDFADTQIELTAQNKLTNENRIKIVSVQEGLNEARQRISELHSRIIKDLEKLKGEKDALSD